MPAQQDALLSAARTAFEVVSGTTSMRLALAHLASLVGEERLPRDLRRRAATPEPLAFKEVERVLKGAWDRPPGKVLGDLEREPHAVTPAAQVHRGEDEDGNPVAVKVRRPGLAEVLRSDLVLIEAAAAALAPALPRIDLGAAVGEVRERLLDELDLEYEAATQRRFARALRGHERLHVPMPVLDLCAENVLVSAWVDGRSIRELGETGDEDERVAAAELLVEFVVGAPATVGVALADPHPDDALLMEDGRLAVVDFGAVREVEPERLEIARRALTAFQAQDADALAEVLSDSGWMPGADATDARIGLDIADDLLGPVLRGEAPLTADALEDAGFGTERHAETIAVQAGRSALAAEDLWPFRGLGQLGLVLARLEVQADWLALAEDALSPRA
jgi:predicted unusual protein kinase regulating ubiquinone biosynthesis (AarF/ABC1/UbiB family)